MIELALATGWRLPEIERLDPVTFATLIDILEDRSARRRHG
jgi:hypothetical protein